MSFKKETEKIVLLKVAGLIHIIVIFRTKKNVCIFLQSTSHILFLRAAPLNIAIGHQVLCSNKGKNWKFIFPWKKINWHVLQTANKVYFSYSIDLIDDFWKKVLCYGVHVSSPWWCTHFSRVSENKAYKKIIYKNFQFF